MIVYTQKLTFYTLTISNTCLISTHTTLENRDAIKINFILTHNSSKNTCGIELDINYIWGHLYNLKHQGSISTKSWGEMGHPIGRNQTVYVL